MTDTLHGTQTYYLTITCACVHGVEILQQECKMTFVRNEDDVIVHSCMAALILAGTHD